jgi:PAS domain S-box-containing protein
MNDQDKSKPQLIAELADVRRRVAVLEAADFTRQAPDALAEREAQLLEAQEVACLGFYVLDIPSGRWKSSSVLDQILGIPADYDKTIDGWANLLHPDERQETLDHLLKEVLQDKQPCDRRYRIVRYSDKQVRWVHGLGRLQFNADGQPHIMLGTIQDITERTLAEEAAHDELEKRVRERTLELAKANEELAIFRKFAEAAGQGFSMADLDGHLTYLNPAFCRMLGLERQEDVLGKHLSICYSEESNRRGKQEIEPALMRDGHWQGELPLLSRTGESITTFHHAFVIRDERNDPQRLAVVITDITERKRAEEALRQSHDELQAIYDQVADGIVVVDVASMKGIRSNAAHCRMLGYSAEEAKSLTVERLHPPAVLPTVRTYLAAILQGGVQRISELPFLRKDGKTIYVDVVSSRMCYDGRPALISFFHDVTERRQAHEALKRHHQTLKHLLQSSDHERQLIAYEIHDGLAQQLAGAIMEFDTFDHLRNDKPKQAADAFHAGMTMLRQGHFEARRLIAGVRPPILDEEGIVAAVGHLVNEQIRRKGPKIEYRSRVEFDRLDPTLENAIYRIAQEALTNACKHATSKRISVRLQQSGDRVRIEIRDWGLGFDPKSVPKSHFGLEGIRQRARLLGGKCGIRSNMGMGTSVRVELPVVPRDEEGA